ncbi:MAG: TetR/AcrR family transcriptional regulator [Sporichthyaceae bacterium]
MTEAVAETAGRRRMPRAEREALMLDVAEELFAEGYQAASMDEIAARVGVSKPMLYHYFGSKEGLFLACLRRARDGMLAAILSGAELAAPPEQRLYTALVAWFRFVDEHRTLWKIIEESEREFSEATAEIDAIRDEHTELIAALLAADVAAGHGDPIEIEVMAASISGMGERIARWRIRHPGLSPEQTARHLMQLLWLGLGNVGEGRVWEPGS